MKMNKLLLLLVGVLFLSSCETDILNETHLHTLDQVNAQPFQLVTQEAGDLPNGNYDARLGNTQVQVHIKNGKMMWMMPSLESQETHLVINYGNRVYRTNVSIAPTKSLQKYYLSEKLHDLGFDTEEIDALSIKEQNELAQFISANEKAIDNEISQRKANATRHETQSLRAIEVGESATFTVESSAYWNNSGIYASLGERYQVIASGEWTDWYIDTDANGYDSWHLAVFTLLRRSKSESWFKLIATTGRGKKHTVGTSGTITADESGPLEFFANDAPGFYWNNFGSVTVTVTRVR